MTHASVTHASPTIEYWFEFASTYSYPATMRIERLVEDAGAQLAWKPFLLAPIFNAQGWNNSPFNIYEVKGRYMWRDLARVCDELKLPLTKPTKFPRNGLLAARVSCAFAEAPWVGDFVRSVYSANFVDDHEISDPDVIAALLAKLGLDAQAVLADAQTPDNKLKLKQQTEQAIAHGIFGAPSIRVGDELFWGNDRVEDALRWYTKHAR